MRETIAALLGSGIMVLGSAGFVSAQPYTGADIELTGMSFSNSSGYTANPLVSGDQKWHRNGEAVYTAWANLWVEYSAFLTAGNWNIGLNAINYGNLGPNGWYTEFQVKNSLNNQTIHIAASPSEVNNGYINVNIAKDGTFTVRYTWLNDLWAPCQGYDANIQINSAFFDNTQTPVPEPTTMLLFGTGLTGFLVARRRKKAA